MKFKQIFVRKETYPNEHRTCLIPKDVDTLVKSGIIVYIQSSNVRVYKDIEYKEVGAILTPYEWHYPDFKDCLILGIKELENLENLDDHTHAYFSHSFQNQKDSKNILDAFSLSRSTLYDFEYFLDNQQKRTIAFGLYAGQVGAVLGLLQHLHELPLTLRPWNSFEEMVNSVKSKLATNTKTKSISIGILGHKGRCGQGVKSILSELALPFTEVDRDSDTEPLTRFDIFYNCIRLEEYYEKVWFDKNTLFSKQFTIVDISCDASKPNNPIQIYNKSTTWESPVYSYNDLVSVIAIDNMPSLLPKESSDHFSEILTRLLLDPDTSEWDRSLYIFYDRILRI